MPLDFNGKNFLVGILELMANNPIKQESILINLPDANLEGELAWPVNRRGLVIFAHGSGSSRLSPRNLMVAQVLHSKGIGTLLFDLLTQEEDRYVESRFDINLLSERLIQATGWLERQAEPNSFDLGYFGASTGAAAAIKAAVKLDLKIKAVVSRGGRPDLAGEALPRLTTPIRLIVGGNDEIVIGLNETALQQIPGPKELSIIPGATHLFEEPGTLEEAANLALEWFERYLG